MVVVENFSCWDVVDKGNEIGCRIFALLRKVGSFVLEKHKVPLLAKKTRKMGNPEPPTGRCAPPANFLQARFWIVSLLPTNRSQSGSAISMKWHFGLVDVHETATGYHLFPVTVTVILLTGFD